ncbi:MAG: hypothetical protein KGJ75_18235 [Alphaproteobacteria bacterium]|nr:hypothetical protein [Alphaproteobacteria bacterium]MDE2074343.1 hypothetical protein [Alphaproteobacteria bacterium]
MWATGVLLPFILEETICRGATSIVVTDAWRYRDTLPTLPRNLRKFIVLTDSEGKNSQISNEIFAPLWEETSIEPRHGAYECHQKLEGRLKSIAETGISAAIRLAAYLDAVDTKAQIHFELEEMKASLHLLLRHSRSSEMRANAAVLLSLFNSYESLKIGSLKFRASHRNDIQDVFADLVETAKYRSLSTNTYALGLRPKLDQVARKIDRWVRGVLSDKRAMEFLKYGSTLATVATGVPIPSSELIESLLSTSYLPPIVDLSAPIERARSRLVQRNKADGFDELLIMGRKRSVVSPR